MTDDFDVDILQELRHILQSTKAGMQILQNEYLEEFYNLGTFYINFVMFLKRFGRRIYISLAPFDRYSPAWSSSSCFQIPESS